MLYSDMLCNSVLRNIRQFTDVLSMNIEIFTYSVQLLTCAISISSRKIVFVCIFDFPDDKYDLQSFCHWWIDICSVTKTNVKCISSFAAILSMYDVYETQKCIPFGRKKPTYRKYLLETSFILMFTFIITKAPIFLAYFS